MKSNLAGVLLQILGKSSKSAHSDMKLNFQMSSDSWKEVYAWQGPFLG